MRALNKWILIAAGLLAANFLAAEPALADGTVTQLAGTLGAVRDGSPICLERGSQVKVGDVITTEKGTYAQIKFSDGMVMTLKPNTKVAIKDQYYLESEPEKDSFAMDLLKGGMRTVSGFIGKRGNRDAYKMNTATATIGIRGTVFDVDDCATTRCPKEAKNKANDENSLDTSTQSKPGDTEEVYTPAVYVGVHDGEVVVKNDAGELTLSAGQFGIAPAASGISPALLPGDPGISQINSLGTGAVIKGGILNCR
jgi:hypothetical protein